MFLYAPPALFTLCPSSSATFTSPRERYVDALAELKAAEESYLTFKAVEREETLSRLKELLRKEEDHRALSQYLSGDGYQSYGLNSLGRDYAHKIALAQHQAFEAECDYCRCDDFASSMYPCTSCADASYPSLCAIGSLSPAILSIGIGGPKVKVAPSPRRLKIWTPSSLDNDTPLDHFPGAKPQLPTPSSPFSDHRREARSLRRPRLYTLQQPFKKRRHDPLNCQDNEQLQKLRSPIPLRPISKPHPVETMSNNELSEESAKLFDVPAGQQIDKSTLSIQETVPPSPCSEELYKRETLEEVDFVNFFHVPPSAPSEPAAEVTLVPEAEDQVVPNAPTEFASTEGELDTKATATTTDIATAITSTTTGTTSTEISSSFNKIRAIEAAFNALKENFTLPAELDFLPSPPSMLSTPASSDSETASATDHLTYSPLNRPIRTYEHALTVLLEQLDGVESLGDADVRRSRKEVVRRVERALEELEREVEGRWRIRVLEAEDGEEKEGGEGEGEDEVLELGLDESESERKDDAKKEVRFDERADVVSSPFPIESIVEQDGPSTTTANTITFEAPEILPTNDDATAKAATPCEEQVTDAVSVVEIPALADAIESGKPTSIILSSTRLAPLDAPAADNFHGDTEPTVSTPSSESAQFLVDIVESVSPNFDIDDLAGEPTIPINIPAESAAERSYPVAEPLKPLDKNTELTTSNSDVDTPSTPAVLAQAEAEDVDVRFMIPCEVEDSTSQQLNVHDDNDDWFEVPVELNSSDVDVFEVE